MMRLSGILAGMALVLGLAACKEDRIRTMSLGLGGYAEAPVLVIAFEAGGIRDPLLPEVVDSGGDTFPRSFRSKSLEPPTGDPFLVRTTWIDIATGQAWEAEVKVDQDALTVEDGIAWVTAIFGPGARLVIGSDPTPVSTTVQTIDVARTCGTRRPDLDRDLGSEVDAIPFLREALASAKPEIASTTCTDGAVE